MYDENEILEAVFEGIKKWAYSNLVRGEDLDLIRDWATDESGATLTVKIEGQEFILSIKETEKEE